LQPGQENVEVKAEDEEQGFVLLSAHLFSISMKCTLGAKSPSDDRMEVISVIGIFYVHFLM
jgi:hypothetical protein